MAKEHMMVVFENKHDSPKVFYRFAEIYLGLQDYDKAKMMVTQGLKDFPNDAALRALHNRIIVEIHEYNAQLRTKLQKQEVILDLGDERSNTAAAPEGLQLLDKSESEPLLNSDSVAERKQLANKLIQWRHAAEVVNKGEVQSDLDDWKQSDMWRKCWSAERLKYDKSILHAVLPLTLLSLFERILIGVPEDVADLGVEWEGKRCQLGTLPTRPISINAVEVLRGDIVEWLTRNSVVFKDFYRPFTIHFLGARGDMEMESQWHLILERCPFLETLQVVLIGFRDNDDPYSRKLSPETEYLSPPLVKKNGWRLAQKVVARLYKGDYMSFLTSELVKKTTATEQMQDTRIGEVLLPSMLTDLSHPFHPDLVVIPEPSFHDNFQSWVTSIATLALSGKALVLLGQSVLADTISHEALSIPRVIDLLGMNYVLGPEWNKFAVPLDPGADAPEMLLTVDGREGTPYRGPSGKYACKTSCLEEDCHDLPSVVTVVKGFRDNAAKGLLTKLANDGGIEELVSLISSA
eukprot:Blabericola_migrator_1__824@NODE_1202_length_5123_cov_39_383900_g814_i0_p1_GENE_NODE_1202_length_5123_cov_39_383900_g814_i0NODE_1202_length_5123_cov_39_383900_g814_i0_p1_ORF_typecomplete_len610_score126_58TPR_15/PF13429_6/23TPR_15/PF13429_6/0_00051ANAPC3/PF12895_7/25ANAPC3/PF12895_7/0_11TPR_19/PF14559_6/0_0069TPR_8/PF13181_6/6_2e02TPR_8/PF13181_6/0_038YfiO/PF13525_6/2_4e02YfiO/PF13525_6/0_12TPR_16/PF13432_6/59TPR_16/PF13432_6/3_1TPR_2/PF07719_17/6_2TPR_2/PF07719_17/32Rapsyn_N/PF10579_9/0_13Rapsy